MANPISSALGTQRQFSKQPERPYQKSLIAPNFGSGINYGANGNLQALASSLGLFGKGLLAESIARDKRAEKIGEAGAERVFAVASEQDKEKLGTLDILGRSEKFELADNPYAIARIDELRGQHLNTLYKNEYDLEVFPNQELPKTSQENIQRYEDFMEEKLNSYEGDVVNKTAFAKGFYGSRPVDVLNQDAKYRKQRQANLEADRNASIGTKIEGIVTNSINKPVEETVAALQDAQTDSMLSALSLTERIKIAEATGKGLAANGNPELLNAWGETVLYFNGVDEDGKAIPIKVKDRIPMEHYVDLANKYNVSMNEEKTRNFLKSIEDVPPELLADAFEKLKLNDPSFYKAIAPQYDTILKRKITERAKRLKEEAKVQLGMLRSTTVTNTLNDRFDCYRKGIAQDSLGYPVDSKNIPNNKAITESEIVAWGNNKLRELYSTLPIEDAAKESMKLLSFNIMKPFRDSLLSTYSESINLLTPQNLKRREGEELQLPGGLSQALSLYKIDNKSFRYMFPKLGDKVALLNTLITANGLEGGVNRFSLAQTNILDSDFKSKKDASAKKLFESISNIELPVLAGNGSNDTVDISGNADLFTLLNENIKANLYCDMPEDAAINLATQSMKEYYINYSGCAIPRAFFNNIPNSNQEKLAASFLDARKNMEESARRTKVRYIYSGGTLQLWSNSIMLDSWSNTSIATAANKWYQNLPQEKRVEVDDVYYTPHFDKNVYYNSNPDAIIIEQAEQELGVDMNNPMGEAIDAIGGLLGNG